MGGTNLVYRDRKEKGHRVKRREGGFLHPATWFKSARSSNAPPKVEGKEKREIHKGFPG